MSDSSTGGQGGTDFTPLLNAETRTLAGIELRSLDVAIADVELRRKIELAIKKTTFKIIYTKGPGWEQSKSKSMITTFSSIT